MGTTSNLLGLMTAPGAVIAALGRVPILRTLFGSCGRSWLTGVVAAAVFVATSFTIEALVVEDDMWQFLFTFIAAYFAGVTWGVAALVVVVTIGVRERYVIADRIVNGLLILLALAAVAAWVWMLSFVPSEL